MLLAQDDDDNAYIYIYIFFFFFCWLKIFLKTLIPTAIHINKASEESILEIACIVILDKGRKTILQGFVLIKPYTYKDVS